MLAEITQKLVGINFKLCSSDISEGVDCFRLCMEYLRMRGAKIPDDTVYKGYPIFGYMKMYSENPTKTMQLAASYLSSILTEVKLGYEIGGDILILRMKKRPARPLHLGIYGGNDQVIVAVVNDKTRVVDKNLFDIEKVLRWVQD